MALKGLEYVISLTDQLTSPLKGVMKSVDALGKQSADVMKQIGVGAAGLVATGMALKSALDPAIEFSRAVADVRSLDAAENVLDSLQATALRTSSTFGIAARDMVASAYNIQSAVGEYLTGDALSAFTEKSAILAKATMADANTMTGYIGTMFSVLRNEVNELGQSKWIDQLSGRTATAIKMFKTTGSEMNAFFANLGASASAELIGSAEQMAIAGMLQAKVGGAVAGTQYKSFLSKVMKAQKELGLTFTDNQGKLLGMVDILKRIRGKYGKDLFGTAGEKITKAFGDVGGNLVKGLITNVDDLDSAIRKLEAVTDSATAEQMAKIRTDPWQRLYQTILNVKTAIGTEVLKPLEPLINKVADLGAAFVKWLTTYKNIAWAIGVIIGSVIGFAGITASITLFTGMTKAAGIALKFAGLQGKLFSGTLGVIGNIIPTALKPLTDLARLGARFGNPFMAAAGLLKGSTLRMIGSFKALWTFGQSAFSALSAGFFRFAFSLTTAPLATFQYAAKAAFGVIGNAFKLIFSPLNLWILLIGAAIFIVYKFRNNFKDLFAGFLAGFGSLDQHLAPLSGVFDTVKGAIGKIIDTVVRLSAAFGGPADAAGVFSAVGVFVGKAVGLALDAVVLVIELMAASFSGIADIFADVADVIISGWNEVTALWAADKPFQSFLAIGKMIGKVFKAAFRGVINLFIGMLNVIIEKANLIPGINIPLIPKWEDTPDLPTGGGVVAGSVLEAANVAHAAGTVNIGGRLDDMPGVAGKLAAPAPMQLDPAVKPQTGIAKPGMVTNTINRHQTVTKTVNINTVNVQADNTDQLTQQLQDRAQLVN